MAVSKRCDTSPAVVSAGIITKPRNRLLALLAASALALAACGAPAADTEPTPSTTTVKSTTTTHHMPSTTTTEADDHVHHVDHEEEADQHPEEADDGTRTVQVVMNEFTFSPESVSVSAGETVRFVIINEGLIPHEFRLSNHHRIEEHLASGHADHGDDGGHHAEEGDLFIEVAAGESGELVVTFPQDTTIFTDIACLLEGHYEAGMKGSLAYE